MGWITGRVAIGNYLEVRGATLLKEQGFRSAISLDGTLAEQQAVEFGLFEVASYSLVDGPGNDLRVFRFARDDLRRLAAQGPVLVQCHAGRTRSVIVVAAYLLEAHRISAMEAISRVAAKREINVTPALVWSTCYASSKSDAVVKCERRREATFEITLGSETAPARPSGGKGLQVVAIGDRS